MIEHVRAALAMPLVMLALFLAGCGTPPGPEPEVRTVRVEVPVPVACAPDIGPRPAYPDTDEALRQVDGIFDGVKLLKAGRLLRQARERELEKALDVCRAPPPPTIPERPPG